MTGQTRIAVTMKKIELIVLLAATVFAIYLSNRIFLIGEMYNLVRNGTQTEGTVIEKREQEHRIVRYRYAVDEKEYVWGGYAGDVGKEFFEIKVGDKVVVYYDSANPASSSLGDPTPIFNSNLRGAIIFSFLPTFLYLGYLAKKKWFPQ